MGVGAMRISVLVVSYNVCAALRACLLSLADADEVIVIDNASSDDSVAMVRREFPQVKLLARSANDGFSAGVNCAAKHAKGDAFLLLNPDAALPAGALHRMSLALTRHAAAWAIGFRQVDEMGHFQLAMGPKPTLPNELLRRFVQRRLDHGATGLGRWMDSWWSAASAVPWVAGSSLLVRREAFRRVGGFDEKYFLYFEGIDFWLRLQNAGGSVYYDPSITVVHHRGLSAKTDRELAQRAYRISQLRFWERHRGPLMRRLVERYLRWSGGLPAS